LDAQPSPSGFFGGGGGVTDASTGSLDMPPVPDIGASAPSPLCPVITGVMSFGCVDASGCVLLFGTPLSQGTPSTAHCASGAEPVAVTCVSSLHELTQSVTTTLAKQSHRS
jgi:hypothetical protein